MFCFCQFHWGRGTSGGRSFAKVRRAKVPQIQNFDSGYFKYINPLIHTVVVDGYLNIVKYVPEITVGFTECPNI